MEKVVRSKLKNARKLYQDSDFLGCLSLTDEIIQQDENNYHAHVLKAASCDQLGMDDEAADCFWRSIRLDKTNVLAWQGLVQMGSKNKDRYYSTLVCACLELIPHYSTPELNDKLVSIHRLLVELLVRHRLALPSEKLDLRRICESLLKVEPRNPYALEALIRLKIEAFFFGSLTHMISPNLSVEVSATLDPLHFCRELVHSETVAQIDLLTAHITDQSQCSEANELTASVENTVQLGRLARIVAMRLLADARDSWAIESVLSDDFDGSNSWSTAVFNAIGQMGLNGHYGIRYWRHLDLMDFHVMCFLTLATFTQHSFSECENITEQMLSYINAHQDEMQQEVRELQELASVPISQLTDFLQPRPAVTPFRLQPSGIGLSVGTTLDCLIEWILAFRLANASASEQPGLARHVSRNVVQPFFSVHQNSLHWPGLIHTLWLECCLTDRNLSLSVSLLLPDTNLELVTVSRILSICDEQWTGRAKLCCLWAGLQHALQCRQSAADPIRQLANRIFQLMEEFDRPKTSREHFLFGRLLNQLLKFADLLIDEVRLCQPVEKECYTAGIATDATYFANHLALGRICRRVGQVKEALEALKQAKKQCPRSPECAYELALAFCQNNQVQQAFDCYGEIDQKLFTKAMWLNYGLIALQLRNTLKSVPALQKVIILDPKNALYWEILGEAYLLRRSFDTAIKTLTKSIELDPNRPLARILCGQAYRGLGENAVAQQNLELGLGLLQQKANTEGKETKSDRLHLRLLALKELIELNLGAARNNLDRGLSGQALDQWNKVLLYLAEAFDCSTTAGTVPVWALHFAGSAFSLIAIIHDPDLRVSVPNRLLHVLRFQNPSVATGCTTTDADCTLVCPCVCLRLATIYCACALKRWSSVECAQHACSNPEIRNSSILQQGSLLVTIGLQCLVHARHMKLGHATACTCQMKSDDTRIADLFDLAESFLKRACRELNDAAQSDRQFLDECENEQDVAALSKIDQLETSANKFVQNRLTAYNALRSKAWYGLAEVFALRCTQWTMIPEYCLCQAVMTRPQNSKAVASLALRMLNEGRHKVASSMIAQLQAIHSENVLAWLSSAHLTAVVSNPAWGEFAIGDERKRTILRDLLQAACLGANVQVATHLVRYLFPTLLETIHSHAVRKNGLNANTRSFVRLAIEVASEAQNRALAFEPKNPTLWHNRGILLQLSGFGAPSTFCLRQAMHLQRLEASDPSPIVKSQLDLLRAQYFLASYLRGLPDWSVADQLVPDGDLPYDPTLCTSCAEALAKGIIFLHHPNRMVQYDQARRCLTEELTRLACQQGSETAATALSICSDAGLWIVLSRWFSGFPRQSNNPPSHMFDSSQPETTPPWFCPPHLGIQLSQAICSSPIPKPSSQVRNLCRKLLQAEQYYNSIWSHHDYEAENSSDGFHPLADLHYPGLEERALWSEYNSWLVGLLDNGHPPSVAYLTRYVAQYPTDSIRWTVLGRWLFNKCCRRIDSLCQKQKSSDSLTSCWPVLIHCVRTAVLFSNPTPFHLLLTELLSDCTSLWLSIAPDERFGANSEPDGLFLLQCLRRAGALFPQIPGIHDQLLKCTNRLVSHSAICK
ncbi:hypothetical protein FBUS_01609 [Fasciolopsis buskii]|uniref:Tetratricopeptide repeat protein 37 n=1 Tax=Fasciolopsis buskii TaxID=27845 RepID=A0A8E0RJX1_9TREM|nr:hypothetical protein FBUS_01609 [Fasciolopsis buski]